MILLRKKPGNLDEQLHLVNLPENNNLIAQNVFENNGQLPPVPPIEIHPYSYTRYNFGYDKMIIGTFPPISYLLDNHLLVELKRLNNLNGRRLTKPLIPFYHGNRGGMWDVLLFGNTFDEILKLARIDGKDALIDELTYRFIRYDDIIYSTQRKILNNRYNAEDKNLFNIVPKASLIKDIIEKKDLFSILFNTSSSFSNKIKINRDNKINIENDSNIKSFDLFVRTLQELNYSVDFMLDDFNRNIILDWTEVNFQNLNIIRNSFKHKVFFKVRIRKDIKILKEIFVVTPFSPAARKRVELNPIVKNWLSQNPNKSRRNLLTNIYTSFSLFQEENKEFLYSLNYYE
ncbi:hypothetical protein [Flavobacterium sp.]|uniref:hypothetical protein n=1 Tax=Flavobacterium sp. TaxID=239 RepID=UPI00286D15EB|nr:hypothetical protein [Flavobacterium sp.]